MDGDGTIRYSIGTPWRDHAEEVAELANSPPSRPSKVAADINISRRNGETAALPAVVISAEIYRSKAAIPHKETQK
jgi:hypothetical protein